MYNWVQEFSEGRSAVVGEEPSGRPIGIATEEAVRKVQDMVKANRRATTDIDSIRTEIGDCRKKIPPEKIARK